MYTTMFALLTAAASPAMVDTVPPISLPSGMSYAETQRALRMLRPIIRSTPNGRNGLIDGIARREIDGLLVDETQTRIGRDFFEVFHAAWERPVGAMNYTVRIQEQPSPSLGTRVVVLLDDEVLFQLQLQPRYEVVEELAMQAALFTAQEVETRRPGPSPAAAGDPPG